MNCEKRGPSSSIYRRGLGPAHFKRSYELRSVREAHVCEAHTRTLNTSGNSPPPI